VSQIPTSLVRPALKVVPFLPEAHLQGAVEALLRLCRSEGLYPHPLGRWVALIDGQVAGHISITAPHPYLIGALDSMDQESAAPDGFCEVSKFFVDPSVQGRGTGTALFETAFRFARNEGLQPALAVVDTSLAARRFYAHHGMTEAGSFQGVHGKNFVFVDSGAQTVRQQEPAVASLAA
jgi:GNAT superfamily N-acetyltransferase